MCSGTFTDSGGTGDSGNYYSINECNRMFSIVNLLCEIVAIENEYFPAFIPEKIPEIDNRVNLYYELIWKKTSLEKSLIEEEKLLNQNKFYVSQHSLLNFKEIVFAENKRHNDFFRFDKSKKKRKKHLKLIKLFPFLILWKN